MKFTRALRGASFLAALGLALAAQANEAAIRKNLSERIPNFPAIDEVRKSPIPGLWEVRIGSDLLYTDDNGDHIVQGQIYDAKNRVNLTEARINALTKVEFSQLPVKDAVAIKQGTGSRKMAVFVDPNCGYCKQFERDLLNVKDVTIYTFLYPILGADSSAKSRDIWCAKDPAKAWRDWMVNGKAPAKAMGKCEDEALARNVAFGKKYRVQGTPAIFFEDGSRVPGVMPTEQVEKRLAANAAPKKG